MKLVVDTNILVSFFRPNPVNKLILKSKFIGVELFSPEYVVEELKKNEKDILNYSKLTANQFNEKLKSLFLFVKIISKELLKSFEKRAKFISPHDKDIPIFALALKLNALIWSNEPAFKKQAEIKVLSTRDMIELFT